MNTKPILDRSLFYPALFLLFLMTLPLMIWPEESQNMLIQIKVGIEDYVGTLYQVLAIATCAFVIGLAFGKHGHIRLGKPEYRFSTFSWASMLFCSGSATGIIYWGTIEWAYYVDSPPFGIEAGSPSAFEYAAAYGIFHWSFVGWAFYVLPAIGLGYVYYIQGIPLLRLGKACTGMLEKSNQSFIEKWIDLFFMISLLGSSGTALGLGTPMISSFLATLWGIPDSFTLKLGVIAICTLIFSASVYMGLGKGISRLSQLNILAGFVLLAFVFLTGPTRFILKMGINSAGLVLQNMVRMLTWTDPLSQSRFVEDWTIFYWAWWIAVGPFMGIFIARISGGRTLREIILGTLGFGTLGSILFFVILGNYALDQELSNQLPLLEWVRMGKSTQAITAIISSMGPSQVMLSAFCLISFIFMATSFDSISFTLAAVATQDLPPDQEPARWHRLFWAILLVLLPIGLMYMGGLEALKLTVLISAFPLMGVYVLLGWSLIKHLHNTQIGSTDLHEPP